ncbi:MAG: tetratricopeptide repeat protein [bacterium]|nr:tetratricopeptide repeat protein [bacterium]
MAAARSARFASVAISVLALVLTVWAYEPATRAPFYLDDAHVIVVPDAMHMSEFSADSVSRVLSEVRPVTRPVANLSLALNHLYGGLDPRGYHLVNIGIHLLNGFALAWLIALLLAQTRESRRVRTPDVLLASICASAFLLHPLATQAVTYTVQRMTSLATLFTLLSLSSYVFARAPDRSARAVWFIVSGLFALLGAGSKEIAFVLPWLIVLYELCRARGLPASFPPILLIGLALALGAFGVAIEIWFEPVRGLFRLHTTPELGFGPAERVLTQARVVFFYLSLFLWPAPSRLNLEHEFSLSTGLLDPPSTLLAIFGWLMFAVAGLWIVRRHAMLGFSWFAFLSLNAIESGPVPLEQVNEHRFYLPMVAIFAAIALALAKLPSALQTAGSALLLALCVPLSLAAHARNQTWSDPLIFHRDAVAKSPNHFRARYELGRSLWEADRDLEAAEAWEQALELQENSLVHVLTATALLEAKLPTRALTHYRRAVEIDPDYPEALYGLAWLIDLGGGLDAAAPYYERYLSLIPSTDQSHQISHARERLAARED